MNTTSTPTIKPYKYADVLERYTNLHSQIELFYDLDDNELATENGKARTAEVVNRKGEKKSYTAAEYDIKYDHLLNLLKTFHQYKVTSILVDPENIPQSSLYYLPSEEPDTFSWSNETKDPASLSLLAKNLQAQFDNFTVPRSADKKVESMLKVIAGVAGLVAPFYLYRTLLNSGILNQSILDQSIAASLLVFAAGTIASYFANQRLLPTVTNTIIVASLNTLAINHVLSQQPDWPFGTTTVFAQIPFPLGVFSGWKIGWHFVNLVAQYDRAHMYYLYILYVEGELSSEDNKFNLANKTEVHQYVQSLKNSFKPYKYETEISDLHIGLMDALKQTTPTELTLPEKLKSE